MGEGGTRYSRYLLWCGVSGSGRAGPDLILHMGGWSMSPFLLAESLPPRNLVVSLP